jgi:hypothetical protein
MGEHIPISTSCPARWKSVNLHTRSSAGERCTRPTSAGCLAMQATPGCMSHCAQVLLGLELGARPPLAGVCSPRAQKERVLGFELSHPWPLAGGCSPRARCQALPVTASHSHRAPTRYTRTSSPSRSLFLLLDWEAGGVERKPEGGRDRTGHMQPVCYLFAIRYQLSGGVGRKPEGRRRHRTHVQSSRCLAIATRCRIANSELEGR